MSFVDVEIKYLNDSVKHLEYIEGKSDWIDLRAAEDVEFKKGDYQAHVVPRSSTFKNYGLIQTNHMGVIDQSYCGDDDWWYVPMYATRDCIVHKDDRICQFRIMQNQPKIVFDTVKHLEGENRGGFGSTGIS